MRLAFFYTDLLDPNDPARLRDKSKALTLKAVRARFHLRVSANDVGNFAACRPLLKKYLLDESMGNDSFTLVNYVRLARMLQLDRDEAVVLVFAEDVQQSMNNNPVLMERFQTLLG